MPPEGECQQVEGLLAAAGADMAAWHYAKRMRRLNLTGKQQVRQGRDWRRECVCGVACLVPAWQGTQGRQRPMPHTPHHITNPEHC